ncbi:MAG TPA: NADP-dependent malic enzyme [Polyangiaceae bacterium]|nr:NADP-dependent malic enzyme [Polyangiaceae bacterium]
MIRAKAALEYHAQGRPGKIEVVPTKSLATQHELSLAYSPGVAEPCREIYADPSKVNLYTARKNLVAVVTNGTAVLGLGNIGPLAAKPVMEGKGVLFKRFADIDVFDIEVAETDPQKFVDVVAALEPTFGGINLEDVRAPDCFVIERALRERMKIPVFHDDQHGTAIISAAALENAALVQKKKLSNLRVVCIGAGAAAISCMELWMMLGVRRENICMLDSRGVIREDRDDLEPFRRAFAIPASDPRRTLEDAFEGADVMMGLASGGLVTREMLAKMADRPIILALANPDPEIPYEDAVAARPDAIVATGRSDYPNQVNNVLGFPFIFRGALDVAATTINEPMKLAAARALAELAREDVPDDVRRAYGVERLRFGKEYIIPKPFDARVLYWVAPAVAGAAIESGVAREPVDVDAYRDRLVQMLSPTRRVMWNITARAKARARRVVYPEGDEAKILRAASIVVDEGIAHPILIGSRERLAEVAEEAGVDLEGMHIINPAEAAELERYAEVYWKKRQRKGVTQALARRVLRRNRTAFGMLMVECGDADGLVAGLAQSYPETIRPALQVIGTRPDIERAAGMYMVITKSEVKFLADTTINIDPDAETLASTAMLAADTVRQLGIEPRVAMLSFSNFGDAPHPSSIKVARATAFVRSLRPDIIIDGEMQANVALDHDARAPYPFCALDGPANVLIFPNLDAGNIAYKLLQTMGSGHVIGPMVLGLRKPVNGLQQGASVEDIVNITAITVAQVGA